MEKLYPDSKVEVRGLEARYYDVVMDAVTLGRYRPFIEDAIRSLHVEPSDRILDLGAGGGRNACLIHRYLGEDGQLVGWEIGEEMRKRFLQRCGDKKNVRLENRRIDLPHEEDEPFDKAFISFVLHGLPHERRLDVLKNVHGLLKPGGTFNILDYTEFDPDHKPFYARWLFKYVECPYAADYAKRDWRKLLSDAGFGNFQEKQYFWGYARLLTAEKLPKSED